MTTTLFYVFIVVVLIQLIYFILFSKLSFFNDPVEPNLNGGVSILVAAKNEAQNLSQHLPYLLNQNFDQFEVIVINDASTDNSVDILNQIQLNHPHLKILTIPHTSNYQGQKKNALTQGIAEAKYSNLLFTDADCKPATEEWISHMTSGLENPTELVLGYGAYKKIKGSFLNKLIRFETLLTGIQYLSYTLGKIPYMGVGRNLAYKKSLFLQNGFDSHAHILSGDDDLFVNQMATKNNTSIVIHQDSFTVSEPKKSWLSWINQKRRHVSTATEYNFFHQILLTVFYFSQLLFWSLAIFLLGISFNLEIVLVAVIIRILVQILIYGRIAKKLKEGDLILILPILDFLLVFIQLYIFSTNLISKPKNW